MKPERRPADAAKPIKEYLAEELPARVAPAVPSFGINLPKDWKASASAPHIAVFDDGGPARWPISTRPTIRITVFANGRDLANRIAGAALGLLMAGRVPGISTITEPTALIEGRDSNTGGQLASFTVRAQIRTIPA